MARHRFHDCRNLLGRARLDEDYISQTVFTVLVCRLTNSTFMTIKAIAQADLPNGSFLSKTHVRINLRHVISGGISSLNPSKKPTESETAAPARTPDKNQTQSFWHRERETKECQRRTIRCKRVQSLRPGDGSYGAKWSRCRVGDRWSRAWEPWMGNFGYLLEKPIQDPACILHEMSPSK